MTDNIFRDILNNLSAVLFNNNRELITILRTPNTDKDGKGNGSGP